MQTEGLVGVGGQLGVGHQAAVPPAPLPAGGGGVGGVVHKRRGQRPNHATNTETFIFNYLLFIIIYLL